MERCMTMINEHPTFLSQDRRKREKKRWCITGCFFSVGGMGTRGRSFLTWTKKWLKGTHTQSQMMQQFGGFGGIYQLYKLSHRNLQIYLFYLVLTHQRVIWATIEDSVFVNAPNRALYYYLWWLQLQSHPSLPGELTTSCLHFKYKL